LVFTLSIFFFFFFPVLNLGQYKASWWFSVCTFVALLSPFFPLPDRRLLHRGADSSEFRRLPDVLLLLPSVCFFLLLVKFPFPPRRKSAIPSAPPASNFSHDQLLEKKSLPPVHHPFFAFTLSPPLFPGDSPHDTAMWAFRNCFNSIPYPEPFPLIWRVSNKLGHTFQANLSSPRYRHCKVPQFIGDGRCRFFWLHNIIIYIAQRFSIGTI